MKNKSFTAIPLLFYLIGCAPLPPNQPSVKTENVVKMKQLPKLTPGEKNILKANGFSAGVWSENCNNKNAFSAKYYDDGEKYLAEYSENGSISRKGEFYEVRQISPGVIQFKMQNFSQINNSQFISSNKIGYLNGKRISFDLTILPLNGPNAGIEIVSIKDGFDVKPKNDGTLEKIKPANSTFKCN